MRLIQVVVLVTALSCAAHAGARDHTRYMNVVNRAHDSVTSLAIAAEGSGTFREKPLDTPLRGGGDSATFEVASDSCLYDLRFGFHNGRTLIYKGVDLCRYGGVRISRLPRASESAQVHVMQLPRR
jgi:hypothetical protein